MVGEEKKPIKKQQLPDDVVIIGSKAIEKYALAILNRLNSHHKIRLYANLSNTPNMERLIHLFKVFGVDEVEREFEGGRVVVTISR